MKKKILIINANYYQEISDRLVAGATNYLEENGIDYKVVNVPGALEISSAINSIISNNSLGDNDIGFIAIGCVVRGETSHYDIVANESAAGLTRLSISKNIIVTNSILTVENKQQALDRSLDDTTNKGYHAAYACNLLLDIKNGKF